MSAVDQTMTVKICIPTFRRPDCLRASLKCMGSLRMPDAPFDVTGLVIVDNDPEGSARATVETMADSLPLPIRYVVEPTRGFAAVRNRAIEEAGTVDCLAWLDDDETVGPDWLRLLLKTMADHNAAAVVGPIEPVFQTPCPDWKKPVFLRDHHPTGTVLPLLRSGNLLLKTSALGHPAFQTDPPGMRGTDTLLGLRLVAEGHRIVWCEEALAYESIPPARLTLHSILHRSYCAGNVWAWCERITHQHPHWRPRRLVLSSGKLLCGIGLVLLSPLRGRACALRGLQSIWHGCGGLLATAGIRILT